MNATKIVRYTALILGFQASFFFTFFLIADCIADLFSGKINVIPIVILMILSVAGYIWAVTHALKGSIMMIIGGIALAIYLLIIAGIGEFKMALIFGLPFIVPGLLFYYIGADKK
jgi:hypothetical protein